MAGRTALSPVIAMRNSAQLIRKAGCAGALLLVVAHALAVAAADSPAYPAKPIRLIVASSPGGPNDIIARIVALPWGEALGRPLVVDNRAGAAGAIGTELGARAAPDGYTLLLGFPGPLIIGPLLSEAPNVDALKDFAPISLAVSAPFVLLVNPQVPAASMQELVALAKARPGKLNFASGGTGISSHMAMELFKLVAGISMVHVPYKGEAAAIADLLAGHVHFAMITTASALSLAKEGRLRNLATLLPSRSSIAPEVPTLVEAGLNGVSVTPWAALLGPAKLPREIVERLSRELNIVLKRSDVREQLSRQAFEAEGSSPEAMTAFLAEQTGTWARAAKEAGIQPD